VAGASPPLFVDGAALALAWVRRTPTVFEVRDLWPGSAAELFRGALPSKLFDVWACERPVALGVDGEARALLEEARAGIFVPPEDAARLAAAIVELAADPAGAAAMGWRGRALNTERYSRAAQAQALEQLL